MENLPGDGADPGLEQLASLGWQVGDPPQKAPHETPYGGYTEEQMAQISNRKGVVANIGSPLWAYQEKLADEERPNLPHARRAARHEALKLMLAFCTTVAGSFPSVPIIVRFILFSITGVLAASASIDAWLPNRKRFVKPLLIMTIVIAMLPLAYWVNSFGVPQPTIQPSGPVSRPLPKTSLPPATHRTR